MPKGNKVFYNKVQQFNRDLSVAALTQFSKICQAEHDYKGATVRAADDAATRRETIHILTLNPRIRSRFLAEKWRKWVKNIAQTTNKDHSTFGVPRRLNYDGLHVFEALSASGLRSLRYFKEVPGTS